MQSFFNKVGKTATEAANRAGSKATELVEIGKLKGKISSRKQDADMLKKQIGEYCYSLYLNGSVEDEKMSELCQKIKAIMDEISDLEEMIGAAKEEHKANTENDPTL